MPLIKREKCTDCYHCQMCAESRCRKCRTGGHRKQTSELGMVFTHGQYLEWKRKKQKERSKESELEDDNRRAACSRGFFMTKKDVPGKRVPVIDLSRCTDCESCLEICPSVFRRNEETGRIEVVDLVEYSEQEVHEAIATCPADCITWEEA